MTMPLLLCLPIAIPFAMLKVIHSSLTRSLPLTAAAVCDSGVCSQDYSRLAFVSVAGIALVCASMVDPDTALSPHSTIPTQHYPHTALSPHSTIPTQHYPHTALSPHSTILTRHSSAAADWCRMQVAVVAYGLNGPKHDSEHDRVDLVTTTFLDWKHYPYVLPHALPVRATVWVLSAVTGCSSETPLSCSAFIL